MLSISGMKEKVRDIITDTIDIKRIPKEYCEQF